MLVGGGRSAINFRAQAPVAVAPLRRLGHRALENLHLRRPILLQGFDPFSARPADAVALAEVTVVLIRVRIQITPHWRRFDWHAADFALCLARLKAGNNRLARMAMMAMTTSNSISVKP